jgi:integrase
MARTKKQLKAKEPIKIRFKKLANGNQSIYLDQYKDGQRTYEFLKLYIIPEMDEAAKAQNTNTMQVANTIKAKRLIELANAGAGITNKSHLGKMLLSDWMEHCREQKAKAGRSKANADNIRKTIHYLKEYGGNVTMKQIDVNFCKGFIAYLKACRKTNGQPFSGFTIYNHFRAFCIALNMAVRDGVIPFNPLNKMEAGERPSQPESEREFLTTDEVKRMMETECRNETLKRAFLFSCFCGLRSSDIKNLTWGDIQTDGENTFLRIIVEKANKPLTLPLSSMALKWLPERGSAKDNDKVFIIPSFSGFYGNVLKLWAANAGIRKNVTFHVARHTFATMELTAGADLYTTCKLLGHADVRTTQIYAKIVDKKKTEAVNLVSNLFD